MNYLFAVPVLIAGAAGIWWLSIHTPKGVLIVIGILLNVGGRALSSHYHMVFGPGGERLGSLSHRLLADAALPLQLLGAVAVIHGIVMLFKKPQAGKGPSASKQGENPDEAPV